MVNYKLALVKKDNIKEINLNTKKLEDIDAFTMKAKDEFFLRSILLDAGAISIVDEKKKLKIVYNYAGKIKKLPVLYSDIKRYMDADFLITMLKSLSYNIAFLEKLANHYSIGSSKFNNQGVNVSVIRNYINGVRMNYDIPFYSESLNLALEDLVEKAVYPCNAFGEYKLNYRGLRDLAIFVYKYLESLNKKQEKTKNNINDVKQINMFDEIETEEIAIQKKKIK